MMTKSHYLTARCPQGCETWLHPRAVWPHLNDVSRCRRHPWIDDIPDNALIAAPLAEEIGHLFPSQLVETRTFSEDRLLRPQPGEYLREELRQGVLIRSPIHDVPAQRWAIVAGVAARHCGDQALQR